jgi:hypothetical protein
MAAEAARNFVGKEFAVNAYTDLIRQQAKCRREAGGHEGGGGLKANLKRNTETLKTECQIGQTGQMGRDEGCGKEKRRWRGVHRRVEGDVIYLATALAVLEAVESPLALTANTR